MLTWQTPPEVRNADEICDVEKSLGIPCAACARSRQLRQTELVAIIRGIGHMIGGYQFVLLDAMLRGLPIKFLCPEHLLAVLRATFCARERLTEWAPTAMRVREEFDARGLDSNRLMIGLIKNGVPAP